MTYIAPKRIKSSAVTPLPQKWMIATAKAINGTMTVTIATRLSRRSIVSRDSVLLNSARLPLPAMLTSCMYCVQAGIVRELAGRLEATRVAR